MRPALRRWGGRAPFADGGPRPRRASLAAMVAELRGWLYAELCTTALRLAAIERHTGRQAERLAAIDETLDRVLVRLVAIERQLAIVEAPAVPRSSRRRPLE